MSFISWENRSSFSGLASSPMLYLFLSTSAFYEFPCHDIALGLYWHLFILLYLCYLSTYLSTYLSVCLHKCLFIYLTCLICWSSWTFFKGNVCRRSFKSHFQPKLFISVCDTSHGFETGNLSPTQFGFSAGCQMTASIQETTPSAWQTSNPLIFASISHEFDPFWRLLFHVFSCFVPGGRRIFTCQLPVPSYVISCVFFKHWATSRFRSRCRLPSKRCKSSHWVVSSVSTDFTLLLVCF